MGIRRGEIVLPDRAEAIGTITRFTELDSGAVTDYVRLAEVLGSMSAALSAIALEYGENHRLYPNWSNIGLWTKVGEGLDRHKFTTTSQDEEERDGASIWRSPLDGDTNRYYRHVEVPTARILRQFLDADPSTLRQGYTSGRPHWEDIYALAIETDRGERTYQNHWPFHMPISRPAEYPTTPAEDATSYTQILQTLSTTLLEVIE